MTGHVLKRRQLLVSVLAAGVAAVLPLFFPFFTFLWFPGSLILSLLVGPQIISASFNHVRALVSAGLWSLILYYGTDVWKWGQMHPTRSSPPATKYIFVFWIVLLIP